MRKTIAAATVAASIATGGLAGAIVRTPALAGATETANGAVSWVQDALSDLVDDGTITQEQSEAVATALEEARPERWRRQHGIGVHVDLSSAAESLGVPESELRTAIRDGRTIAEVAAEQGRDVQTVVDAIVAAQRERIEEDVAAGRFTQERADEMLTHVEELAEAVVNGEMPPMRPGRHRVFGGHPGVAHADETTTDSSDADA